MTPRVVRTVEELEGLPNTFAFTDSMGDIGVMLGGQAWYPETNPMGGERAVRKYGPLTVLAPLSVTSEQVEAGVRASFVGGSRLAAEAWDAYPFDHPVKRHERNQLTAALAAMGIEVVDHV